MESLTLFYARVSASSVTPPLTVPRVLCAVQVVWDDRLMRLFVLPTGSRPLGLLFRANKGQVDFEGVLGET